MLELLNLLGTPGEAARNAAGWEVCLEGLGRTVTGDPGADPQESGAPDWEPLLAEYAAHGLPDDGWRPDDL